jgi:glycosyltransferase involved in cell wall biosynthesis
MHIAIITAGGAGMFCGACMHDNTWARALIQAGVDVSLIPTYTPIRVDEADYSLKHVFLGGINVYLNGKWPWWHRVPRSLTSWLDRPGVIRLATRFNVSNDAARLGDLTLSMLAGEHGPHRQAIHELAKFLARDLRPDLMIFSNALLSGALQDIKSAWPVPVLCALQGEDVFLDGLPAGYRDEAIRQVSERAQAFDRFLVHTDFYCDHMADYLSLPEERFRVLPLGIEVQEHTGRPRRGSTDEYVIGYFARMAPEKGLHNLVEAFQLLRERVPHVRLKIGGYQGPPYVGYLSETLGRFRAAGISVENIGSPATIKEKVAFLSSIDAFTVPTDFREPKGMYVLEALANGVPVVQPAHGAFPEILERTRGGVLVTPRDPRSLAEALAALADPDHRFVLAQQGWQGVRDHYGPRTMADRTLEIIHELKESKG